MYALAVLFTAYTGVRVAELQGLQVGDLTLSDIAGTVGSIRVARTKKRQQGRKWIEGTPKVRRQHQSRSPTSAVVGGRCTRLPD